MPDLRRFQEGRNRRMTYCLALKVKEGLLCLADGRVTTGTQVRNAHKASLLGPEGSQYCVMTSGLRSLRDKTLAYLEKTTKSEFPEGIPSMLEAVSRYAAALRQVAEEDRDALANSELNFNLHTLLAGQLSGDEEPTICPMSESWLSGSMDARVGIAALMAFEFA